VHSCTNVLWLYLVSSLFFISCQPSLYGGMLLWSVVVVVVVARGGRRRRRRRRVAECQLCVCVDAEGGERGTSLESERQITKRDGREGETCRQLTHLIAKTRVDPVHTHILLCMSLKSSQTKNETTTTTWTFFFFFFLAKKRDDLLLCNQKKDCKKKRWTNVPNGGE